jgi:hypothetical protein
VDENNLDGFGRGALVTSSVKGAENRAGLYSIVGSSVLRSLSTDAHQRISGPEPTPTSESKAEESERVVEVVSAPIRRPRSTGSRITRKTNFQKVGIQKIYLNHFNLIVIIDNGSSRRGRNQALSPPSSVATILSAANE